MIEKNPRQLTVPPSPGEGAPRAPTPAVPVLGHGGGERRRLESREGEGGKSMEAGGGWDEGARVVAPYAWVVGGAPGGAPGEASAAGVAAAEG